MGRSLIQLITSTSLFALVFLASGGCDRGGEGASTSASGKAATATADASASATAPAGQHVDSGKAPSTNPALQVPYKKLDEFARSTHVEVDLDDSNALDDEAKIQAYNKLRKHFALIGDSYVAKIPQYRPQFGNGSSGGFFEARGLNATGGKGPISESDKLNGVQWQGFVNFNAKAVRAAGPDAHWSDWQEPHEALLNLGMEKKNGAWRVWTPWPDDIWHGVPLNMVVPATSAELGGSTTSPAASTTQ